jgi:hypothetical protein
MPCQGRIVARDKIWHQTLSRATTPDLAIIMICRGRQQTVLEIVARDNFMLDRGVGIGIGLLMLDTASLRPGRGANSPKPKEQYLEVVGDTENRWKNWLSEGFFWLTRVTRWGTTRKSMDTTGSKTGQRGFAT